MFYVAQTIEKLLMLQEHKGTNVAVQVYKKLPPQHQQKIVEELKDRAYIRRMLLER
jgi:hypothetical protein